MCLSVFPLITLFLLVYMYISFLYLCVSFSLLLFYKPFDTCMSFSLFSTLSFILSVSFLFYTQITQHHTKPIEYITRNARIRSNDSKRFQTVRVTGRSQVHTKRITLLSAHTFGQLTSYTSNQMLFTQLLTLSRVTFHHTKSPYRSIQRPALYTN